ncbi:MAG TPA: hypothetical protein VJZ01_00875 [Lachnospiraceae bacterium]|jgi:hypothetical protein|nr:hypothetical protein [Lachnospiraceae bacterium]
MNAGVVEIDLHGLNVYQAKIKIDSQLMKAGGATYRLRLVHGYHGGTGIKDMIEDEYGYGRHDKVIRIQGGNNPGITELVLREL